MNSAERRWENTLRISFADIEVKPSKEEIYDLIVKMVLPTDKLIRTHLHFIRSTVYLQMGTLEQAQAVVERNKGKHGRKCGNVFKPFDIEMEDGAIDVFLQDLPYYITDDEVRAEMAKYGEILSIRELRHPEGSRLAGILMGTRAVRMIRKLPIASYITIEGEVTGVTYRGQIRTCAHCQLPAHHGVGCAVNRMERAAQNSYADALKSKHTTKKHTHQQHNPSVPHVNLQQRLEKVTQANTQGSIKPTNVPQAATQTAASAQHTHEPIVLLTKTIQKNAGEGMEIVQAANSEDVIIFKTPLDIPSDPLSEPTEENNTGTKRPTDDSPESDASSSSQGSQTKRKPGRPLKHPKTM